MCLDLAHMHQITNEAVAVIDEHESALEIHIGLRKRNDTACWCMNWRTFGRRDIDAIMRRARLAVQDALASEHT